MKVLNRQQFNKWTKEQKEQMFVGWVFTGSDTVECYEKGEEASYEKSIERKKEGVVEIPPRRDITRLQEAMATPTNHKTIQGILKDPDVAEKIESFKENYSKYTFLEFKSLLNLLLSKIDA